MNWNAIFSANPSVPVVEPGDYQRAVVYLAKVRLNRGGYDSRGRYFGHGEPLYEYDVGDTRGGFITHGHVRGRTRAEAKERVREKLRGYDVRFTR